MKAKSKPASAKADLRARAEASLRKERVPKGHGGGRDGRAFDHLRLVHELQVHQVELETQNAELSRTRDDLELALENYTKLYELAPVGYFTISLDRAIKSVNLSGCTLVGIERPRLLGRHFAYLFPVECHVSLNHFLRKVFTSRRKHSAEFRLVTQSRDVRTVTIEARRLVGSAACLAVAVDITERKQAEEASKKVEILAASNDKLKREIARRKKGEVALKASEAEQKELLIRLRKLSHQILNTQEEERKRISRELHDEIAQMLVGITVHLAALSKRAARGPNDFLKEIGHTQRLLERSVKTVHDFARELRPAILDDLGLIPALTSFLAGYRERTNLHVYFSAFKEVEHLGIEMRTVLYRIVQESMNNVVRHANASHVSIIIRKDKGIIVMKIHDNGKSFKTSEAINRKGRLGLGILGMKERVDMMRGSFEMVSGQRGGTTVIVELPLRNQGKKAKVRA